MCREVRVWLKLCPRCIQGSIPIFPLFLLPHWSLPAFPKCPRLHREPIPGLPKKMKLPCECFSPFSTDFSTFIAWHQRGATAESEFSCLNKGCHLWLKKNPNIHFLKQRSNNDLSIFLQWKSRTFTKAVVFFSNSWSCLIFVQPSLLFL